MAEIEKFHHYDVLRREDGSLFELGRGAMGITYKAFDTNLRVTVALKVINATYLNSEVARQRFVREARAAARLSHPNVAAVFHLGESEQAYFYAMEFIAGETVEARVKRGGPLTAIPALEITLQVAKALRAAEREGLVHRDIKPANLMLVADEDDELFVKVIDFGLAKSAHKEAGDATVTIAGFVGTPHFASPEQLEEHELDVRSDIYSLGITFWWMLAGKPPFAGSLATIMRDHLQKAPPFEIFAGQPPEMLALLRRMLEKDPGMRPQNASELRREIETVMRTLLAGDASVTPVTVIPGSSATTSGADFATQAFAAPSTNASATSGGTMSSIRPPSVGLVLGHYRLLKDCGDGASGRLFQALDNEKNRAVGVKVLHHALLGSVDAQLRAEREVDAAKASPHPALTELYSLERTPEGHCLLVTEWVNGFSLLDLLRGRSRLTAADTVRILEPVAAAADHGAQHGLHSLGLGLPQVMLGFDAEYDVGSRPPFLTAPLAEWPEFHAKVSPVSLAASADPATIAPEQTMVSGSRTDIIGATDYPRRLASLAFEMLSGSPPPRIAPGTTTRIPPLPSLGEEGNTVLRKALNGGFATATEFMQALKAGGGGSSTGSSAAPVGGNVATPTVADHVTRAPDSHGTPPPTPPKSGSPLVPILVVVSVLVAGGAAGVFFLKKPDPTPVLPTPTPAVAIVTPAPSSVPRITPTPFVVARLPTPTPEPVVVPKDRREQYLAALDEARKTVNAGNPVEQLDAYLKVAQEYTDQNQAVEVLDSAVNAIVQEAKTPDMRERRFRQLRKQLDAAAVLGSQSALLFLGGQTEQADAGVAADYYKRAADKGSPKAMIKLGNLLFKGGPGLAPRPGETADWYRQASDRGDVLGKILLAECYREGKGGVGLDFQRSALLLNEALAKEPDNSNALDLLAVAYEKGYGVPVNPSKARELLERAVELGNSQSMANLGAYYMNGIGMPRADQRRGVELFKRSADADNPIGMFFYAQCLEAGLGGRKDEPQARIYYRASAERGFALAIAHCEKKNILYNRR